MTSSQVSVNYCGDFSYNGPVWTTDKTVIRDGSWGINGNGNGVWIGGGPDPYQPIQPYQPYQPYYQPVVEPNVDFDLDPNVDFDLLKKALGGPVGVNLGWREVDLEDEENEGVKTKVLATDMPGVHGNMLAVSVEEGKLRVVGQRFDTGETVEREYELGDKFDPSTAEAELTHGVLTVRIKMHQKFKNRTIKVAIPDE